ncbi:MAG TPA: hypothetical protein PK413_00955, partial [Thermoanaerobaculia bacterium]|nr:hypothetical protein [Thermoanaerobaculia bacterium]
SLLGESRCVRAGLLPLGRLQAIADDYYREGPAPGSFRDLGALLCVEAWLRKQERVTTPVEGLGCWARH